MKKFIFNLYNDKNELVLKREFLMEEKVQELFDLFETVWKDKLESGDLHLALNGCLLDRTKTFEYYSTLLPEFRYKLLPSVLETAYTTATKTPEELKHLHTKVSIELVLIRLARNKASSFRKNIALLGEEAIPAGSTSTDNDEDVLSKIKNHQIFKDLRQILRKNMEFLNAAVPAFLNKFDSLLDLIVRDKEGFLQIVNEPFVDVFSTTGVFGTMITLAELEDILYEPINVDEDAIPLDVMREHPQFKAIKKIIWTDSMSVIWNLNFLAKTGDNSPEFLEMMENNQDAFTALLYAPFEEEVEADGMSIDDSDDE